MTERPKFEIVGDLLCEWTDKCTCGGYCEPYWMHEKGCGLEPVIPLDQLDKLLTPSKVYFPGDTVPAETEVQTKLGNVYRWREDRVLASYFGPVIEVPPATHEVWQAAVDRAHQARLAEATAQPLLSDPGTGEA